jgi:hypothetical protein
MPVPMDGPGAYRSVVNYLRRFQPVPRILKFPIHQFAVRRLLTVSLCHRTRRARASGRPTQGGFGAAARSAGPSYTTGATVLLQPRPRSPAVGARSLACSRRATSGGATTSRSAAGTSSRTGPLTTSKSGRTTTSGPGTRPGWACLRIGVTTSLPRPRRPSGCSALFLARSVTGASTWASRVATARRSSLVASRRALSLTEL